MSWWVEVHVEVVATGTPFWETRMTAEISSFYQWMEESQEGWRGTSSKKIHIRFQKKTC